MTDDFRPCLELLFDPHAKVGKRDDNHPEVWAHLVVAECRYRGLTKEEAAQRLRQLCLTRAPNSPEGHLEFHAGNVADWAYRCPSFPISCRIIRQKAHHLCNLIRDSGQFCPYEMEETREANRRRSQQRPQDRFEEDGWPEYLKEIEGAIGEAAAACYLVLREKMVRLDLTYNDTIFISMREFQRKCQEPPYRVSASLGTIVQAVNLLGGGRENTGYGLILRTEQGKPRRRGKKSNGYRITLPTPPVPGAVPPTEAKE